MLQINLVLVTVLSFSLATPVPRADEDAYLTVSELIVKYGYPVEEHFVTTEDGYILRMHRIPHGRTSKGKDKVVFLMHGLLCSSADWIITGTSNGLGYILADEGYDVWMGNGRGNTESRNHTTLDPDKNAEFWHFSWHEIGVIDVAAMIDYVLDNTQKEKLYYIGHSQGSTSFYVLMSMKPEYNDKVQAHFSLAPIAYMNHMTSPLLHILAFFAGPLDLLAELIGINEFLPSSNLISMVGDALCKDDSLTQILCTNALFAICGFSPKEMNASMLPVLTGHTPAGASVRQLVHYAQEIVSGTFRQYDYGLDNLKHYGSLTPPNYDLKKITTPIYLLYSHNDWMAAERDVVRLCQELGEACRGKFLVSDDAFNHLDYLYGIRAPAIVYDGVISLMVRH